MFQWDLFWKLSSISAAVEILVHQWARRPASSSSVFCCTEGVPWGASHLGLGGISVTAQGCKTPQPTCILHRAEWYSSCESDIDSGEWWVDWKETSFSFPYRVSYAIIMKCFPCLFFTPILREFSSGVTPKYPACWGWERSAALSVGSPFSSLCPLATWTDLSS